MLLAAVISILAASGNNTARPPGLTADGPLDVGCQLSGTPGYTSYQATITLYNPGDNSQTVSQVAVDWGSNGVLLSQQPYTGNWTVGAHEVLRNYASAPGSATSCDIAGWNP